MKNNYDSILSFLTVDLHFLHYIGKQYFYCAEELFKENKPEKSLYPFCLLSTTALELFLKVIIATNICLELDKRKEKIDVKQSIMKKLKKEYSHDIKEMIDKSGIKGKYKINKVERCSNKFVNDYRLHFKNGTISCFKDSESIRFGSLAKKPDLSVSSILHFNKDIVVFLEDLSKFSFQKKIEACKYFKNAIKRNAPK